MTARITKDFNFIGGVYFENELYLNVYDINVHFNVESSNISEQNIALDRIKYFFYSLEHHVFIYEQNTDAIEKLTNADIKLCVIPEEPYDQIIAIMLLTKINAITEGRLIADDLSLTSRMSDGVNCLHGLEENIGPFKLKGWWNENSPKISNLGKFTKSKKIVKLKKTQYNWDDLNLGYNKKDELNPTEIVFASFESKTDK
jgi:hypothetical protein